MPTKPTIAAPFAGSGDKNTIPTAPQSGGLASLADGFPPITEQPVSAGGLPPQRKDFNGILNLLSEFAFYQQSGGLFTWSNTLDYTVPAMVVGSDGKLYLALLASGPSGAGAKDPTIQPTYWQDYAASIAPTGPTVDEFYIDAGAMTPAITGGAASGQEESSTNKINRQYMSFRGDTANTIAQFSARMPSNWNHGTVKAMIIWESPTGASAGNNVRWLFSGVAVSDGDALDAAFGSTVNIDDTVTAVGDQQTSAASAAMTIGNTPAAGDLVTFKVERVYNYGGSPLTQAARVLGMVIQYGISGNIAAW